MSKLFILGNGFDLSVNLPTAYLNFKKWLENRCELSSSVYLPEGQMGPHGDAIYDDDKLISFLYELINSSIPLDPEWNQFERGLGELDFDHIFYDLSNFEEQFDREGDVDNYANACLKENIAVNLERVCKTLNNYFEDWISSIDIKQAKKECKVASFFEGDSRFLTFNYTNTLEDIYDIDADEICHIHGSLYEGIIVGHGLSDETLDELYDGFEGRFTGAEHYLYKILINFKKDVAGQMKANDMFFNSLKKVSCKMKLNS